MEISTNREEKGVVISVKGRMDATTSPDLEKQLTEMIDQGDTDLIIDFAGLDYISSAGLRSILATAKKLKAKNGTFSLAALQDVVKEVFEISGFDAIIPIHDSVESARENI